MLADTVAAVMILIVTAYVALAGADFGGGMWDLLAGSAAAGARPRDRIDRSITPVWESNHVWLIIALVVLWTGFPSVFAAIFTTLFVPLSVAGLGIVLRGSGFAFRAQVRSLRLQAATGGVFAFSSLLTPFFLGTVVGAVVTGRVRGTSGDPIGSWVNATSMLTGALFVVTAAYLAAVYLAVDSEQSDEHDLRRYFTRRAIVAGVAAGVLAAVTMAVLRTTARPLFTELTSGRGLPFVVISVVTGVAVLVLLLFNIVAPVRPLAALAVAAVVWGWAVAQYPDVLPPGRTIASTAAPTGTMASLLVIVGVIVILIVPSFVLLFRLATSGQLAEGERPPLGAAPAPAPAGAPAATRRAPAHPAPAHPAPARPAASRPATSRPAATRPAGRRNSWPAALIVVALVARKLARRGHASR
jgi:cytochrome bd ubiquinol oxidase subunit II